MSSNKLGQDRRSARSVEEGGRRNRINPTKSKVEEGQKSSKKVEKVEKGREKSNQLVKGRGRSRKGEGEM
jgi:hypothetical protein